MALSVIDWKRTNSQYVAILQSLDRFDPASIRPIQRRGMETVLGGTLKGSVELDWYALAYDRNELEFAEARDMARQTLDQLRENDNIPPPP